MVFQGILSVTYFHVCCRRGSKYNTRSSSANFYKYLTLSVPVLFEHEDSFVIYADNSVPSLAFNSTHSVRDMTVILVYANRSIF